MAVTISTPKNLYLHYKENTVARTDTTAKDLFTLPAGSTPMLLVSKGEVASDAGTTATIDVGAAADPDYFHTGINVLAAGVGAVSDVVPMLKGNTKFTVDTVVTGTYAETGTASNTGGPWTIGIFYIRA